jgi:hypothetical protein
MSYWPSKTESDVAKIEIVSDPSISKMTRNCKALEVPLHGDRIMDIKVYLPRTQTQ